MKPKLNIIGILAAVLIGILLYQARQNITINDKEPANECVCTLITIQPGLTDVNVTYTFTLNARGRRFEIPIMPGVVVSPDTGRGLYPVKNVNGDLPGIICGNAEGTNNNISDKLIIETYVMGAPNKEVSITVKYENVIISDPDNGYGIYETHGWKLKFPFDTTHVEFRYVEPDVKTKSAESRENKAFDIPLIEIFHRNGKSEVK